MTENEPIKTVSDGITFLSTGRYYDGINRWVAHKLKDGDNDAIDYAARQIAKLLPQNAVLVPIPGHHGKAEQTMQLAKAISSYTHLPIVEALRGIERGSQYDAKKRGQTLSAEDMGFYRNIHFNGHPMKATSIVIPFPSMPIRCRLIPNIGLFILSLSILS